ncbi:DNA-directed DNA polymerase [Tanacetum coccineum]
MGKVVMVSAVTAATVVEVVVRWCCDGGVDDKGGVTVVLRVGGDGRGGVATVAAQVVRRLWVGRDGGDWVGVGCEQVFGAAAWGIVREFLDPKKKKEIKSWLRDSRIVDSSGGSNKIEYFDTFPTLEELEYHEWLLKYPKPSWYYRSPPRRCNPGSFTLPCLIGPLAVKNALADLGASINLMPHSLFRRLGISKLKPTKMSIQLADRSIKYLIETEEEEEGDDPNKVLAVSFYPRTEPVEPLEWRAPENQLKPSSVEPPKLELKELPKHLEYAFLQENNQLPVVISSALSTVEKTRLLEVLRNHKGAIALRTLKESNHPFVLTKYSWKTSSNQVSYPKDELTPTSRR